MFLHTGAPCGLFVSFYRHDLFRLTSTVRLPNIGESLKVTTTTEPSDLRACLQRTASRHYSGRMHSLVISNATIVTPGESVRQGSLLVTDGRIAANRS